MKSYFFPPHAQGSIDVGSGVEANQDVCHEVNVLDQLHVVDISFRLLIEGNAEGYDQTLVDYEKEAQNIPERLEKGVRRPNLIEFPARLSLALDLLKSEVLELDCVVDQLLVFRFFLFSLLFLS